MRRYAATCIYCVTVLIGALIVVLGLLAANITMLGVLIVMSFVCLAVKS